MTAALETNDIMVVVKFKNGFTKICRIPDFFLGMCLYTAHPETNSNVCVEHDGYVGNRPLYREANK